MEMARTASRIVRFGIFDLDFQAGELRKQGMKVKLQEQPLQMLCLLLERPGEVVTREELKQKLWPGTIVDFDHSLNTTINKLREALGDSAGTPRFIETLPRRGYRFIYPVNGVQAALEMEHPASDEAAARPDRAPPRTRRPVLLLLIGVAAAVLAAVALNLAGIRDALIGRASGTTITAIAVLPLRNLASD